MSSHAHERWTTIRRRIALWGTVTCADLANELGVAVKTIQRDLDQLAEAGEVIRVHGGAVSRRQTQPQREAPLRIGVLLPTRTAYYSPVRQGIEAAAAELDVELITGAYEYSDDIELIQLRQLADLRIDGLLATLGYDTASYVELAALDVPTVLVERPLHLLGGSGSRHTQPALVQLDHVYSDHVAGAIHGLDHLFGLGHREVRCLIEKTPTSHALLLAIREIEVGPRLPYWGTVSVSTLDVGQHENAPDVVADVVQACRAGRHTALLAHPDILAITLQAALSDAGVRVPGDVSLLSYDDVQARDLPVPISAVSPRRHWVGQLACEVLVDRLRSRGKRTYDARPPHRISLLPQLVLRGTTAPPA